MLKLGTQVLDRSTQQWGMLTLMQIEANDSRLYHFQPHGLAPKTGVPLEGRWIVANFIEKGVEIPDPNIPLEIMGTLAEDKASGYKGRIVSMRYHLNGCIHVSLQSEQIMPETGTVPDSQDFDLRRLKGEKIPVLNEDALEESRKVKPSPMGVRPYTPRKPNR